MRSLRILTEGTKIRGIGRGTKRYNLVLYRVILIFVIFFPKDQNPTLHMREILQFQQTKQIKRNLLQLSGKERGDLDTPSQPSAQVHKIRLPQIQFGPLGFAPHWLCLSLASSQNEATIESWGFPK